MPKDTTNSLLIPQSEPISLVEEMKRSYLDYAMSVIVSRALPDVRDGLKPVHRRILYHMKDRNYSSQKAYNKSARIVGEVMGRFHPHGDSAIYGTLVRMAQSFSMRVPLIDGQGNFGSIDDDPPAAMRYTEARLTRPAESMLEDIDFDTVPFRPNYDESDIEPEIIPSRLPNLLVNGTEGIAVGMATSIPPHNLQEVVGACLALIKDPDLGIEELMEFIPGPDLPTSGILLNRAGMEQAYRTGRGGFVVRGRVEIEAVTATRNAIIITEIPYQIPKTRLIDRIAECVRNKVIEGISDIRDLSNRAGIRVVIELKRNADSHSIIQRLYKHTPLQSSYNMILLAIHRRQPRVMSLKEILQHFIEFREEVVTRRLNFELRKKQERAHDIVGLLIAMLHMDRVVRLIRAAKDRPAAHQALRREEWPIGDLMVIVSALEKRDESELGYHLSDQQAKVILDLPLHRLTALERAKFEDEGHALAKRIKEIIFLLSSRPERMKIIQGELQDISQRFGTKRLSEIQDHDAKQSLEALVTPEDVVVVITRNSQIKRMPISTYRSQHRGGKGLTGMDTRQDDTITQIIAANTLDTLLFFTNDGIVLAAPVHTIHEGSRRSKGRSLHNVLRLSDKQRVTATLNRQHDQSGHDDLLLVTSFGGIRRNKMSDFARITAAGKVAMRLDEGEELVNVAIATEDQDVFLSTKMGRCIRFSVNNVRVFTGRTSRGVRGIRLSKDDFIVSMAVLRSCHDVEQREDYLEGRSLARRNPDDLDKDQQKRLQLWSASKDMQAMRDEELFLLTISDKGFGKLTSEYRYRRTQRAGSGMANIQLNERIGTVVASFVVSLDQDVMLVTDKGGMIRCRIGDIRPAGRSTQGVRLFNIDSDDCVVSVACFVRTEEDMTDEDIS